MPHCPGCGAGSRTPPEEYGHILGCGFPDLYPPGPVVDQYCPWGGRVVREIIARALVGAKLLEDPGDIERVDIFARALAEELRQWNAEGGRSL